MIIDIEQMIKDYEREPINDKPCILISYHEDFDALASDLPDGKVHIKPINSRHEGIYVSQALADRKFRYCDRPEFYAC